MRNSPPTVKRDSITVSPVRNAGAGNRLRTVLAAQAAILKAAGYTPKPRR